MPAPVTAHSPAIQKIGRRQAAAAALQRKVARAQTVRTALKSRAAVNQAADVRAGEDPAAADNVKAAGVKATSFGIATARASMATLIFT